MAVPAKPPRVPSWTAALLATLLIAAPAAVPSAGHATVSARDSDGDTLPDRLERLAGLRPRVPDLLSYVGGRGCSDRRPASTVRSPGRPWCGIERAVAAAPAGATVLVRAGTYGRLVASRDGVIASRDGVLASQAAERSVRIRAYPRERVVLRGADISVSRLRLERFRITGTVNLLSSARRIALVGNRWITDGRSGRTNLNIAAGVQSVLVERNTISQLGSVGVANAINFSSTNRRPPISGVRIRGNRIGPLRGGGDAIQAKNTRSLVIEDNEIFGVSRPPGSSAHPDAVQTIYGAVNLTIRRNFIHDIASQGVFVQNFRGPNLGFRAEDNVIVRVAGPWTEFAVDAVGARVVHNTIGGLLLVRGRTRRATVVGNIADVLVLKPGAQVVRDGYNLARRFVPRPGRRSIGGSPRYRNPRRGDFRLRRGSRGRGKGPRGRDIGSRRANRST